MQEHPIIIPRTGRYFTLGSTDSPLTEVWFVCHGYGQLASDFLQQFEILKDTSRLIIAPEGLSRFYWQGFSGKVGASWMTREDRGHEIDDYIHFLDSIYAQVFERVKRSTVKCVVLGFSQGCATVCRWLDKGKATAEQLILWAGLVPPDVELTSNHNIFNKTSVSFVIGNQDEIATPAQITRQETRLKEHQIAFKLLTFDGGHELNMGVLQKLAESE